MAAHVIEVTNVSFSEAESPNMNGVSFTVSKGEIACLLCGEKIRPRKVLDILCGASPPTSGDVRIARANGSAHPGKMLTRIPPMLATLAGFSAVDNLQYHIAVHEGVHVTRVECSRALQSVGLDAVLAHRRQDAECSLFEHKMTMATAVALDASVWLLDDPFAKVGRDEAVELTDTLYEAASRGVAVVLVRPFTAAHGPAGVPLLPPQHGPRQTLKNDMLYYHIS